MPNARARAITVAHRREMFIVSLLIARRMRAMARGADASDIDGWWIRNETNAVRTTERGSQSTATLGARYMRQHARAEGVDVDPLRRVPPRQQIATSLHVMGPVAFKKHMALFGNPLASLRTMEDTFAGAALRLVLAGERDTFMATFADSPQIEGWQRVTGGSACAFCDMLASRGGVYRDEASVDFQAHDSCRCSAEPLYEREDPPRWVEDLRTQWDEAGGDLNEFRKLRASA